ncbi:MAG: polysaccharide biosynthesis tyrosine autokinase, partial [Bacteroidota bacterium]
LRYATNKYQASASIRLTDDKGKGKLPEISKLQTYGLFATNASNVLDEVEILKSRAILEKVVLNLGLNTQFSQMGRVKEQEIYENAPLNLNFIASDSIIHTLDTTFYVKIVDPSRFIISDTDNSTIIDQDGITGKTYSFGDKVETHIGDLIITPNIEAYEGKIGANLKIKVLPVLEVVEVYKTRINILTTMDSNVISFTLQENIKKKAEDILNELIASYNDDAIRDKEEVVKATSDFINNRLEIVSRELEQVDLTAENVKKSNRLSNLQSQSAIFLQTEKENEQRLIQTSNQIQIIDYMSDHISENNEESDLLPSNIGLQDPNVAQITKNHNDLVLQRNRILKNSSAKNPTVVNLDNQINALKENLNQSLENLKRSQQITLDNLNAESVRISSQIYSAPAKERQFRDINRQQSIKESLYLYLLQKREESAITLGMASPKAKIVERAYTSAIPVFPKKSIVYVVAFMLGLIFPIAYVYLNDLLDSKIHTKDDLTSLVSAPYIGDIPRYGSGKKNVLVSQVDYSPKAEAFRLLRTNVDFMLRDKAKIGKTIFVTSTTAGEGKSHTSVNLAMTIAHSGKKVLLIETDIRVPNASKYLKVDQSQQGLTDYISDASLKIANVVYPIDKKEGFDIIPSGTIPPNPAELLMSERIKFLFTQVKKQYDYIIVDTAAVGLVTDTLLITEHADMFLYVVSANNLDKRQLHVARTMYDEKRLPNMAVLLNGTKKKAGYGYGYGYGSNGKKKKWYQFRKA